jgi:DNA polymerase-3 subunit alpha
MASDSFAHLHVHTEYSMLDGAARLDDLFARTAELDMGAIAMTDHGNVFGAYDFWSKARAHGIKPIIGMEAYFTTPPATTRSGSGGTTAATTTSPVRVPTPT